MHKQTRTTLLVTAALTITIAGCGTAPKNTAPPPAPAPIAVAPAPAPAPMAPPPAYVIEDVNFDHDKSTLKPTATDTLDQVATGLRHQPDVRYEVAGHTDSDGSDAYNQSLSERRAASVQKYLIDRDVDSRQLSTRGYGETNPVATNATKEGRAKNRRVEVRPIK
jgi:outer membrane protein OmpA-like peptidoglycan-associated protein